MKLKQKLAIKFIRLKFKALTILSTRKTAEKAFELFCTPFLKTENREPAIFKSAESLSFNLDGIKINGYRWNKDKEHKILILHGFGSAAHNFYQYSSSFIDKGYQVLAFDAPAHGLSEGATVNARQYGEMIEKVCSLYGPIDSFLAHSFGGMAVSLALEKMPHDAKTKIVFIAPATETTTAVDEAFKILQITDEAVRAAFDKIIFEKSGHQTAWFSIKRALENIKATILWIHDEDDDITPLKDALKVKEQNFKNIEFVITKGLGHRKIYRDSNIKNMVVNFL